MKTGQPSKRQGKKLKPDDIDDNKKVNDHLRAERIKNHLTIITIVAYYGGFIAIPLLYGGYLLINHHNSTQESTALWSGLTAVVGFLFGHVTKGDGKNE